MHFYFLLGPSEMRWEGEEEKKRGKEKFQGQTMDTYVLNPSFPKTILGVETEPLGKNIEKGRRAKRRI